MLRRTKAQIGSELPPRTREILEIEIPKAAQRDLRRAASAIDWSRPHGASISSLLSEVEGFKLDAAEELAREVVAAGSRPLLLTTRRASAKELARRLADLGAAEADGELEAAKRGDVLRDAPVGCATMASITTAIDLVGFDVVIFVGLDWVPATMLQAAARVHRLGQKRHVTEHYLVALGTLDEVVRAKVIERLDVFDRIVDGGKAQGDEAELAADLRGGGTEDSLLAEFAAACVKEAS
jgi:SWI/SNF-related matrix-associated actin-dependent regulator 1 of chromatin subfamily A